MANIDNAYMVEKLSLGDTVLVVAGGDDPSSVGFEAPIGSLFLRTTGQVYTKFDVNDTDWKLTGWIDELSELLDVQLSSLTPGQILQYNGTKWVNITPTSGTDEKVKVSANDTTTGYLEGKLVSGTGVGLTTLNDGGNETLQVSNTVPDIAREPTGFPTRTTSQLSFNTTTGQFTIQPLAPATSFDYYIHGVKYTVSTAKTANAVDGTVTYFYFDSTQTLQTTNLFTDVLLLDYAYAGAAYWNSTPTPELGYLADERHGVVMDGATHLHFHKIIGTQWINGLSIDNMIVDGTGDLNTHVQCNVENGKIRDEDLCHDIYDTGGKVNVFDLEQELNPIAQIPVLYRTGATGIWKLKTADNFPLIYSGTAGYTGANGLPAYNYFNGSTWTLAEVPNTHYVLIHILGTNDINHPIVAIQGMQEYQNKPKGRDAGLAELSSVAGLPFEEFVPLGTIIVEARTAYTNTPKARFVSTEDGEQYVDWRRTAFNTLIFGSGVTDHGSLTGLADDDHLQYPLTNTGSTRVVTNVNTPTINQVLQYDGTYWTNAAATTGESNTASNVGTGVGIFAQKSGVDLQFKSLKQSGTTTISATATEITISSADQYVGTVTSVAATQPAAGITISGSPITTSGTLTFALANDLAALEGLTGTGLARRTGADTWTLDTNTYLTANQTITLTGDVTGNGSTTIPTTLATVNTTTGTFGSSTQVGQFTVNGKGLITSASNVAIAFPVTSVFGRTGAVVATEGDYSLTQLSDVTLTTPTNGQALVYNGTQWVNQSIGGTGTVTSVAATAPTEGFTITGSPITTSGTLVFTLANDLAAVEGLTTTGITARTGTSTWTTRTITGTTDQITVTNGNGVADNPTIALAPNTVIPGTGSIQVPSGTTAERPLSPSPGDMRFNTTLGLYEAWDGTDWVFFGSEAGSSTREIISGQLAHLSGTTVIPYDNTPPTITEGTEFFSQSITTTTTTGRIVLWFSSIVTVSNSGRVATVSLFRNNTLIGVTAITAASTNAPTTSTFILTDAPGAPGTYTYSGRIGVSASATWYIGGWTANANYGGAANTNNQYVLMRLE